MIAWTLAAAAIAAQIEADTERELAEKLTPEEFASYLKRRDERREKARLEAIAERRHQEMCRAISSIGRPWDLL